MNKYKLIQKIETFAPIETAENWDCVGFMAETKNTDISKIMLCLTPTQNVIKQALEQNCDMIISHHPIFHININSNLVSKTFSPKIDIYSAHTNLDKANGGTTDTLIKAIGLEKFITNIEHEFLRFVKFEKPISIDEFSKILLKISPNTRLINNNSIPRLNCIAFCAGSGSEFIEESKQLGAQCLVTGDLKFHTALDSEIVIYDVGHFESEILILPVLKDLIGDEVEIVFAKEESPFKLI